MPEDKPAKPDVVVIVQDDRDKLYEIVHGKQVPKPVRGAREMEIVSELGCRLGIFTRDQGLGRTVMEMLFGLDPNLQRRPDVGFISYRQWPKDRRMPRTETWDVVPELAVEVVGETDRAEELEARIVEYLEKGVKLLWVVYPNVEHVYVYESRTKFRILSRADELDGDAVVCGFRLPLSVLFEDETPDA